LQGRQEDIDLTVNNNYCFSRLRSCGRGGKSNEAVKKGAMKAVRLPINAPCCCAAYLIRINSNIKLNRMEDITFLDKTVKIYRVEKDKELFS
jgi:hypothetical protein